MQSETGPDVLNVFAQVANEHFKLHERQAARDLIRDAFHILPWELQDLYRGVVELHRAGKREEASKLFEVWLEEARDLDLL
jgi:hypothetical protein